MQAAALGLFLRLGLHYLIATILAVEIAVLHNFIWHRMWTWADRKTEISSLGALLRFNLTNGLVSIAGNVFLMWALAGGAKLNPQLANLLTIAICSVANFLLADRLVFAERA